MIMDKAIRTIENICFGQNIAIVGNSQALTEENLGDEIDSHDVVIRINRGVTTTKNGFNCDIYCVGASDGYVKPEDFKVDIPQVSFWMSPKYREKAPSHFFFFPNEMWEELKVHALPQGSDRPTTGLMTAFMISKTEAAKINLYGFDFWETKTFYLERKGARPVHNPAKEKEFIEEMQRKDNRICLR